MSADPFKSLDSQSPGPDCAGKTQVSIANASGNAENPALGPLNILNAGRAPVPLDHGQIGAGEPRELLVAESQQRLRLGRVMAVDVDDHRVTGSWLEAAELSHRP